MSLTSETTASPWGVDAARLQAELDHLAGFSSTPAPGVTRILFTAADLAGRAYVKSLMVPCYEPGKFAPWIAPPAKGVKGKPIDFDYVKFTTPR